MGKQAENAALRQKALEWIAGLTEKQFAEFFYEAVADRNTSDVPGGRGHLLLADTDRDEEGPWMTELIALPVADQRAGWGDDPLICQAGACAGCGAEVRCWSKSAECPVCGATVRCT